VKLKKSDLHSVQNIYFQNRVNKIRNQQKLKINNLKSLNRNTKLKSTRKSS